MHSETVPGGPGPAAALLPEQRPLGRQTFACIDLDAIRFNTEQMGAHLSPGTGLIAIVKADAYGHGAAEAGRAALDGGAAMLGVAMAEEALPIRRAGITAPILVIGPSNHGQMEIGAACGLDMCVFTADHLRELETAACRAGVKIQVHIKADTGMHRIGAGSPEEVAALLDTLKECPHLVLAGMFTHLAEADRYEDTASAEQQRVRFEELAKVVRGRGLHPKLHVSNSAGAQNLPHFDYDMVRFGISLYGYRPSRAQSAREVPLRPAMQVWSEISRIQTLRPGDAVGYGAAFRADRPMQAATVQIGYGDGLSRLLSGCGRMIVPARGGLHYAPILGRVCMDMTMIDVTGIEGLQTGDPVLVMGRAGELHMDADDIAQLTGTISYEILLGFSSRVPRLYTQKSV
ncbi:MAG: alanine racemase [Clostridia bacterium]|nr:alanine racemase [Clostridia bacterium]